MKKIIIPFIILALGACNNSGKNKQTEAISPATAQTQTDTITAAQPDAVSSATSKANDVSFNGTLVIPPQNHATVTLTMGGTVKNTSLIPGNYVSKGSVLATLENPEFIELQQSYLDSHAQLEYLETEYKRQETLSKEQAASQKKLQQSKADYLSMKSQEQAAAAKLSLLGINPAELLRTGIRPYLEVKAPINGYIGNIQMNLGKHIAAGEPLCEVINKNEVLIRLIAYEKDLPNIHAGEEIEFMVNGLGNRKFQGKLISVGQQVDEVSRSLEVYAKAEANEPSFRPGMYVTARIAHPTK